MTPPSSRDVADDELVRRGQQGDRDALDLLLRRHERHIFGLCRRLTGNHADALDATQEALITIARRIDRFDGRSAFGTWAYRVATNACLDELRRRKRRPEPVALEDTSAGRTEPARSPLGNAAPTADHAGSVVERDAVDAALAGLPVEFRTSVVLRDVLGLDYAEIAAVLGIPIGTVRSRIARGRGQLALKLGPTGNPLPPSRRPTSSAVRPVDPVDRKAAPES